MTTPLSPAERNTINMADRTFAALVGPSKPTTTITLSPADVVALDEFVTKAQDVNGFDYARQAWVIKGRYIKCGHLPEHNCTCYGKMHEGELISPESLQDIGL